MPYAFKQILENVISEKAPGPSPSFSMFHVLSALELIAEKKIGRSKLAEHLEIGEGVIRTLIDRLKDAELITTSGAGCSLTKVGLKLLKEYQSVFEKKVEIGKNELTFAQYNFVILIRNLGHKVKSGVEQRDAAIMAHAKGATTVIFKKDHLIIPSVSDNVSKDFPKAASQMTTLLQPRENDVIIIGSADSRRKAEYGTLAAAWALLYQS